MAAHKKNPENGNQLVKLKKGHVLQKKGDLYSKVYLVKSGLLRSYFVDYKGKVHIYMFAPEGWIMTDHVARGAPAELIIDALEESQVVVMDKLRSNVTNQQFTEKMINRLVVLQKRIQMLMSYSITERYQHFANTYPNLLQRVSQKMIASYLGVTPEALSKAKSTAKHK